MEGCEQRWYGVSRVCVDIILHTKGVLALGVVYHTWGFGISRFILA